MNSLVKISPNIVKLHEEGFPDVAEVAGKRSKFPSVGKS